MRYLKYCVFLVLLLLCIAPSIITAQDEDDELCPELVSLAIESANEICSDIGRNQACYGNFMIEATPREGIDSFTFADAGDVVDISDIQSLALAGMDTANEEWGVAIMRIQANIPDTLPGQNVTFILFGDVEIEDASAQSDGEFGPMQAFYLRTGVGDSACAEAPNSGILVQTPEGVADIALNVNGVDIALGSTAFLQAQAPEEDAVGELRVSLLEGDSTVSANEGSQVLTPGEWLTVEFNEDFVPVSVPSEPMPEPLENIMSLPITLLEREIELPELGAVGTGSMGTLGITPLNGVWASSGMQFIPGEGCPAQMVQGFQAAQQMGVFDTVATVEMDWTAFFSGDIEEGANLLNMAFSGESAGMMEGFMGSIEEYSGPIPEYTASTEGNTFRLDSVMEGTAMTFMFTIESETVVQYSATINTEMCPITIAYTMEYQG